MTQRSTLKTLIASLLFTPMRSVASTTLVTSSANDGPGSLREALASGADVIEIDESVGTIFITETLEYTGFVALQVVGTGQMIDGSGLTDNLAPIFEVSNGADLSMFDLSLDGGGGYDYFNPGGGKGIFVNVGADGVELDEGNDGSVFLEVRNNVFYANGAYCLPWSDNPVEGAPCDDDGLDFDEEDGGAVTVVVTGSDFVGGDDEVL